MRTVSFRECNILSFLFTYYLDHLQRWSNLSLYIPRAQMTSIFEGQPSKRMPKLQPKQGWVIWVLGQKCVYIYIWMIYHHLPQPCHTLPLVFLLFCHRGFHRKKSPPILETSPKSFEEPRIWYTKHRAKGVVCISPANCSLLNGNPKSNKLHPEISP